MPRPRTLTPESIGAAALTVVDRGGLGALTIRAVAAELDVGAMSLYRYVSGRSEIEALVVERVLSGMDGETDATLAWDRRILALARRARDAARAHPAASPLLVQHRHRAAGTLAWGEAVLGALADAGLDTVSQVVAFRSLQAFVFGTVLIEQHGPLAGSGTEQLAERAERHPHIAATATAALALQADDVFDAGCELWIAGIAARPGAIRPTSGGRDR